MRLYPCLCLAAFLGIQGAGTSAFAAEACPAIRVDVGLESRADRLLVCEGAAKARVFFRSHGIGVKRQIHIRLHAAGIDEHATHIGLYDASKDRIDLLTFEQAERQTAKDSLFGMQMNEALYVSVVVHEIAHAIVGQNLEVRPDSLVAHEYIAYVAQLSTMEPGAQSEILRRYDVAAFESIGEMSSTYYGLNPSGFGVKSFRHFQSVPDQSRFIQDLLSGAIELNGSEMDW